MKSNKEFLREKLLNFYISLWEKIPFKYKTCIDCGCNIGTEPKTYMFDHLLEKNKYPDLMFEEWNIYYPLCGDCHGRKTKGFPSKKHQKRIEKVKERYESNND
jgi:hypothetical protein